MTNNLTKSGRQLMTMIGNGDFSFFDDGIVDGSGIWHECLTGESAGTEGMPKTARGVANVIAKLEADGYLSSGPDDDGVWVALTALGADTANELAGAAPVELAPAAPAFSHNRELCSVKGCQL